MERDALSEEKPDEPRAPDADPWIQPGWSDPGKTGNGSEKSLPKPSWWPFRREPPTERPPKQGVDARETE